jgi:TolB protein
MAQGGHVRRFYPFTLHLLAALIAFSSIHSIAQTPLIVNIDNPNFRKLVMAIPTFEIKGADASQYADLAKRGSSELGRLLTFSGLFNVMAEDAYKGIKSQSKPQNPVLGQQEKKGLEGVDVLQWKALGTESLTLGEIADDGGKMAITLRTIDINRGELLVGKKYTKVDRKDFDLVIRRYADLVLEAYTGKPGIFSSKLVFVGRRTKRDAKQIYVADFDGSNVVQITRDNSPHLSPNWSPDGRFITFTSYRDGNPDLFIYDTTTGKTRKLAGYKGINSGSNWAPSGNLVAFSGSTNGDVNIYTISPQGGERKLLLEGAGLDVDPSFSPDGQYMTFVSGRYGNPHIFRAALKWEGNSLSISGDKRLTYAGWYNATPAWSPASDKIAFAGYDKDIDRFDLFMMNPDGTNMERLTIRVGNNESPSWAPNGQMLVFLSDRVGTQDKRDVSHLYVMNRDGSSQRKLETGLYESQTPKWSVQAKAAGGG